MQNDITTVYISEIYCCIVKRTNLLTILQFCTKKYEKIKDLRIPCCHGNTLARACVQWTISEYFMLI